MEDSLGLVARCFQEHQFILAANERVNAPYCPDSAWSVNGCLPSCFLVVVAPQRSRLGGVGLEDDTLLTYSDYLPF